MKLTGILCSATALLAGVLAGSTLGADAPDKLPTINPTGTWELRTLGAGSRPTPPQLLKLKWEGGKLTGTLARPAGRKTEQLSLEQAKLNGSQISFAVHTYALQYENNVLQPTDTNKVTHSTFQGQVNGDTITGKVEKKSWREDGSRTLDWEAKRVQSTPR